MRGRHAQPYLFWGRPDHYLSDPALELMRHNPGIDCVVGFGGGSSLDTAKVLAVLAKNPLPVRQHNLPVQVLPAFM